MMEADSDSDTEFGIRTPPLLDYLQGILRGYTDGQILKELLQNAEDAGASEVQYLYDQRQYGTEHLLDQRLGAFQGPALCSYNNAVFSEDDWGAIQSLSQSGKRDNALKVGRFGMGFSSVYHLTDLPCILSQGYVGIIDPFKKYFRNKHGDRQTGFKRRLTRIVGDPRYEDQLEPFRASLPEQSKLGEGGTFSGTVFRFPLRQSPSELSENVYTVEKTNELLNAFNEDAHIVLLFLRQVERVTIFTKASDSLVQQVSLDVSFEQSSLKELQSRRKEFNQRLKEFEDDLTTHSPSIAMTNTFILETSSGRTSRQHRWVVHHEIALECSDDLRRLYQKLNFLPWIGVAVLLSNQDTCRGRIFCFLPLPPGQSFSGLPVHVHGFFAVTEDRRSIQWPSDDKIQDLDAEWNQLLVDEVLPCAYRKALLKATESVRDNNMKPSIVYAAFPDIRNDLGHWNRAIAKLYTDLFSGHPMLFCEAENEWKTLGDVVLVPNVLAEAPRMEDVVVKTLQAHGCSVVVELPGHIEEAVRHFNGDDQFISASFVIQCLERDTDFDDYSDEERLLLLEYLLGNECDIRQLNKLPLLPTDNGGYVSFFSEPTPDEIVYIPTNTCPRGLVPNSGRRLLRHLQGFLQDQLEEMGKSDASRQLRFLDKNAVVTLLRQALPESLCMPGESSLEVWNPSRTGEINLKWLKRFWKFIAREEVDLKELEGLKLIPVRIEATVTMGVVSQNSNIVQRPAGSEVPTDFEELETILASLGVIFCSLPEYVVRHHQLTHFIPKMSANVIVEILHGIGSEMIETTCAESNESHCMVLSHLLPYLADASPLPRQEQFLRNLAVFSPGPDEFVALESVDVLMSEETKQALPDVRLHNRVCICISDIGLRRLCTKLGCPENKLDDILGYILDEACQNEYSPSEMQELLKWIHANYESTKMQHAMKEKLQDVPFVPNGDLERRKPHELFDRSDDIIKYLVMNRSLLPLESFFSEWQHILADLGLKSRREISSEQVVEAVMTLRATMDKERADALLTFLFEFPEYVSEESVCNMLANVPLLSCRIVPPDVYPKNIPFMDTKDKLFEPKDVVVYSEETCCLVGFSVPLYETANREGNLKHNKVLECLGVRKTPCIKDVLTQLNRCALYSGVDRNHWVMLHYIYSFLNDKIEGNPDILQSLPEKWIFLGKQFVETRRVYREKEQGTVDLRPYRSAIPEELSKYEKLWTAAKVSERVGENVQLLLDVLKEIKESREESDNVRLRICMKILRRLTELGVLEDDHVRQQLLIPTNSAPMNLLPPDQVCYCDTEWTRKRLDVFCDLERLKHLTMCHNEIPYLHAKRLGVRDIREQLLREQSQPLPGSGGILGRDFGQKEDLVTRIRRIMDGYPRDFSILKELVQNADDAKATKVQFVLDCRLHPTKRLLYDTMRELQGPALLAYNDSLFSDEDIRGIQKLGEGSKGDDSDKTGRYGVGFNVVYHLTDCPMFMSGENTLCIFDPTLKYVKDANIASPGRMFQRINEEMLQSYADTFHSFLSFGNTFSLKRGSLFRLALRNHDSELGVQISISDVKDLFRSFREEMFDVLLFLKNVHEITISTWNDDGIIPEETYTVRSALSVRDDLARQRFFQGLLEQKDAPVSEIREDHIEYETVISDDREYQETWLIHQRVGIKSKDGILKSVRDAQSFSNLKLMPKGGVAAKIDSGSGHPPTTKQALKGKCFCFLPLPIETNLPVHIDGYFSVGHESRRSLWGGPEGDVRSDWNILIAEEVIAPAYVCIMERIRKGFDQVTGQDTGEEELRKFLEYYHSFFPMGFLEKDAAHRNVIDEICRSFYRQLFEKTLCLFPVILPGGRCDDNSTLLWKSCNSIAEEKGYFNTLPIQPSYPEIRESLREVLLGLSFPLLETPLAVRNAMFRFLKEESHENILSVDPQILTRFLKTDVKRSRMLELPAKLRDTAIGDEPTLKIVLSYILDSCDSTDVKVEGLPLLLTNDGILREFTAEPPVFHSKYVDLLPELGNEFLHETLLTTLGAKNECFRKLEVRDLVERLSSHLPVGAFRGTDCRMLTKDSPTDPTTKWLKLLWEFLCKSCGADDSLDLVQIFSDWCIFPARLNGQDALLPMNLAKTVLSSRKSPYHKQTDDILTKLNAPVSQIDDSWEEGSVRDFVNRYASDIENVPDVLVVLEGLLRVNRGFHLLETDDCRNILQYINMQISNLGKNVIGIVKTLPCFETIHGEHTDLYTTAYAVSSHDSPNAEQEKWSSSCASTFLKRESFPDEMAKPLGIIVLDELELYRRFILPCFEMFTIDAQWDHLNQLMKIVTNHANPDEVVETLELGSRRLIRGRNCTLMPASYFRDPENTVYATMLDSSCSPPNHPNPSKQASWVQFLKQVGMQTIVTCQQFRGFLEDASNDLQYNDQREKILVEYLLFNHHLHEDREFLRGISSIEFIKARAVSGDLSLLHDQCSARMVSLSAISGKYRELVWSTEPLLPHWLDVQLESTCRRCNKSLKKILRTTNVPTMEQVLIHTRKILEPYSSSSSFGRPVRIRNERLLYYIIVAILGYLSKQCENTELGGHCFEMNECCKICLIIVQTLGDIELIPMGDGSFSRASKLTKTLTKDRHDKLFPFMGQIPDIYNPFNELLYCMGATEQPSLCQYATALEEMATLNQDSRTMYPAAHQAMTNLFIRLIKTNTSEVMAISNLYLLSRSKRLEKSTQLFYNDEPKFSDRLSEFPYPLMEEIGTSLGGKLEDVGMEQILEKLGGFKPRFISEVVVEVPVDTSYVRTTNDCPCSRAKQVRKVLGWSSFPEAIRCILHDEGVNDLSAHEVSLQTSFIVTCMAQIQTELRMGDHDILDRSRVDTGAWLKITGDHQATLFLSHKCERALIDVQISDAFIAFFDLLPNGNATRSLSTVFKTESENKLLSLLSRLGLKTGDRAFEVDTPPVLGSDVEEDVICLLLENFVADLSTGEYVGYNIARSVEERFVYAMIIERIETDESTETAEQFKVKYLIDAGEEMEVDAIWLYRFQRPKDKCTTRRQHLVTNVPQSSERDFVLHSDRTAKGSSVDRECTDLNETERGITALIEAFWREGEISLIYGMRRLMRQWHPYKNGGKLFADEIFKHIRKEISRLEDGVPSGVDSDEDVRRWAHQNNRNQSRYWRDHEGQDREAQSRSRHTVGSFTPPSSYARSHREVSMWCRQANVDLDAASQVVQGADFYQWKSSLCFFAAEKAVRAAQLVSGCYIAEEQNIMDAAIELEDDLDVTREVIDLMNLVEKTSHYPDSGSSLIPQEKFTEERANEVMDISKSILGKVDHYA